MVLNSRGQERKEHHVLVLGEKVVSELFNTISLCIYCIEQCFCRVNQHELSVQVNRTRNIINNTVKGKLCHFPPFVNSYNQNNVQIVYYIDICSLDTL